MSKLAVGSAQFGMDYGIQNIQGKLSKQNVCNILDLAYKNNIKTIDTAQGYGDSESVIGNYLKQNDEKKFNIITKLHKPGKVLNLFQKSQKNLSQKNVYGLLVHNFSLFKENPTIIDELKELKSQCRVKKIGFSLYYPEELEQLLKNKIEFDLIQVAYSIFDRRFERYFPQLVNNGIEIHVRSVFLQGLFFLDPDNLGAHFDEVRNKLKSLHLLSKNTGLSISSICLNFVANNKFINKIIIGVDSTENLIDNINVLNEKKQLKDFIGSFEYFRVDDINILFPHFWKY